MNHRENYSEFLKTSHTPRTDHQNRKEFEKLQFFADYVILLTKTFIPHSLSYYLAIFSLETKNEKKRVFCQCKLHSCVLLLSHVLFGLFFITEHFHF